MNQHPCYWNELKPHVPPSNQCRERNRETESLRKCLCLELELRNLLSKFLERRRNRRLRSNFSRRPDTQSTQSTSSMPILKLVLMADTSWRLGLWTIRYFCRRDELKIKEIKIREF